MTRTVRELCLALCVVWASCGEAEVPPTGPVIAAEVATHVVTTRDGRLSASLPVDLAVATFDSSMLATSADGGFRLHLELRDGGDLTGVVGELKDALNGLGWLEELEKHYESAVQLQLAHGLNEHRTDRGLWVIRKDVGGKGLIAVCDGLARPSDAARVGPPLRTVCQSIAIAAGTR